MNKLEHQIRHEQLVDLLNKFSQYQDENKKGKCDNKSSICNIS